MLKACGLGKYYQEPNWLFRGLDLDIPSGHVLAVLGPNARGKTTLLKTLAGIIEPVEGSISSSGLVGYVPQNQNASVGHPVLEMVVMGRAGKLKVWQNPGKKDRMVAMECLRQVGMDYLAHRPFNQLSGGQKQLVMIARAMAAEPDTLVLDEPASALDLKNQMVVLDIIARLAESGLGVVVTTHDPTHAALIADSVLCMTPEGSVLDAAGALLTSEMLTELYGTPITVGKLQTSEGSQVVVAPKFLRKSA